jgi:multiple sugar transport system substrate-binding protein
MYRILVVFCAFLFAACGGEPVDVREVDLEQVDPSGQQVTFWYQHTLKREELLKEMLAEYSRNNEHGIKVRGEYAGGYKDIFNKMLVGIQGGVLPDLVVAYNNQAYTYYKNGGAIDLMPYMQSPKWGLAAAARGDYFASFLREDNFDGVQVALTPNRSLEVMYYNVDWLKELGYDEPPQSWEVFAEVCRRAKAQPFSGNEDKKRSVGFMLDDDASQLASIVFARGGSFMDAAQKKYQFNTPQVRASLELMRTLVGEKAAVIKTEEGTDSAGFGTGQILFVLASTTAIPYVKSAVDAGSRFAWALAPVPRTVPDPVVNIYGAGIALAKTTPERQLASWLFLKWFTEPEQQARWVEVSGYFPVRRSAAAALGDYFAQNPQYEKAFAWLESARAEPGVMGYDRVRRLVAESMVAAIDGGNIDVELKNLEEKANATLLEF